MGPPFRVRYNAPVVLSYTLLAIGVLMAGMLTGGRVTGQWFTVYPPMEFASPASWFRLVSHAAGHANWSHLAGNFVFILLLGPVLEEKYGSLNLFEMILITAAVTGLISIMVFSQGLLGASGVVFMFIVLSSFVNVRQGEIPLTFILVVVLFLGKEVIDGAQADNVSQLAHIIGGLCGAAFGYFRLRP
jgi:rhomboid protease GluP